MICCTHKRTHTHAVVEIGFEMVEYTVREDVGYLMVCLVQTTVPPVTFSRDVSLVIDTVPGMATGEPMHQEVLLLD